MTKLCDQFKTTTYRPLDAWEEISIAELAQYTVVESDILDDANTTIHKEWTHEIDNKSIVKNVINNECRIRFLDGSFLSFEMLN